MAETPIQPRVDREYANQVELYVTEQVLYRLADMVNAATKAGPIYGQLILPPEQAALKRQAMEQNRGAAL